MEIAWIIVAIIYFIMAVVSFILAYKSHKRQNLDEIQLDELPTEPYEPNKNAAFFVSTTLTNEGLKSEIRSQVFVDIIGHFNKQIKNFQDYINKATLPKLQEYIDKTSKVSTSGFIVAGIVSLIGAITAVFSLFLL